RATGLAMPYVSLCLPSPALLLKRRPPISTLFPYTTLFRSFPSLSVHEHMQLAARGPNGRSKQRWTVERIYELFPPLAERRKIGADRKSTRLNSSHQIRSYAVFCLKRKNSEDVK